MYPGLLCRHIVQDDERISVQLRAVKTAAPHRSCRRGTGNIYSPQTQGLHKEQVKNSSYGGVFRIFASDVQKEKMKKFASVLLSGLLLASCGGNQARAKRPEAPVEPKEYTYRIRAVHPHLTTSYTQGLQYAGGRLWEGTGQHGQSVVQTIDLETGRAEFFARLPHEEFGEGITLLGDKLYQLTWQSNKAYVYDLKTGKKIQEFRYPGEGWGLTTDGEKLYMSDGTPNIYTVDPATFKREKRTTVTYKGMAINFLNELEWIDGKLWANVYTTDQIVIIDPATGVVEGVVDLAGILPEEEITPATDVLNGIAYDAAGKRIFVTGKNWSKLFEIEITEK